MQNTTPSEYGGYDNDNFKSYCSKIGNVFALFFVFLPASFKSKNLAKTRKCISLIFNTNHENRRELLSDNFLLIRIRVLSTTRGRFHPGNGVFRVMQIDRLRTINNLLTYVLVYPVYDTQRIILDLAQ